MDILNLIKARRSIRRFKQEKIDRPILLELIEAARCAPAGANVQAVEYIVIDTAETCAKIFQHLAWAAHVKGKRNPSPEHRPTAYIIVIFDTDIKENASVDAAAAIENILITAHGMAIGSCWLGSIDRKSIANILNIPEKYKVDSVIALGKPAETPVMEDAAGKDTKYYLDADDVLHVPKRPLKKITHITAFSKSV